MDKHLKVIIFIKNTITIHQLSLAGKFSRTSQVS